MGASLNEAKKRIDSLRQELNHHNYLYHVEARPIISDRQYDKLMQELIDLEREHPDLITPDSPTQRVGGEVQTELKPVRHAVPMMSIDNTYDEQGVRDFDERVKKGLGIDVKQQGGDGSLFSGGKAGGGDIAYVLEPKIDGAS